MAAGLLIRVWLLALLALGLVPVPPGHAQVHAGPDFGYVSASRERIIDFFSDIQVQASGDIVVTERLLVEVQGREIKRGLLRDFPTRYRTPDGSRVQVGFEVLAIRHNGASEPYQEESLANGVRLRIGSGALLEYGRHLYEISYRTTRQIGFFADFDELYWNVTGTGWTLPIDHAHARISLPRQAEILSTAVYTGPEGATGKAARAFDLRPGAVSFETTAPLNSYEGLTVAASWPKGLVQAPTLVEQLGYRLRENLALVVAVLSIALLSLYYLRAWRRVRRRSSAQIVPQFEPPDDLSASAVRYIVRQRYDQHAFVAAMLQLIAGRVMRLRKKGPVDQFERLQERVGEPVLQKFVSKLFGKEDTFTGGLAGAVNLADARERLGLELESHYNKLFLFDFKAAVLGTLMWFVLLALCAMAAGWQSGEHGVMLAVSVLTITPMLAVLMVSYSAWRQGTFRWVGFLFAFVMIAPWTIAGAMAFLDLARWGPLGVLPAVVFIVMFMVTVRAYRFLRGYTEKGHRIMDGINGLKRYLVTAEAPRMQALVTAQEQVEFYERLLPYAVALDVGKEWAASFSKLFAVEAAMPAVQAMAEHYGGRDLFQDNPDRAVRRFSRALTPPVPRAATSSSGPGSSGSWSGGSSRSSSSSGSSGGGSSGGGGGGGGGSGW